MACRPRRLQIAARAECVVAGARQHNGARFVVGFRRIQPQHDFAGDRFIERIATFGAIDGESVERRLRAQCAPLRPRPSLLP